MKLTESLPDSVTVDGERIRCDMDFRNVLRMMDVLQDNDLMPEARAYNAVKCIVKGRIRKPEKILLELKNILFTPKKGSGKRLTSFAQDAGFIRAAFRQVYGINLWTAKLHWIEFRELLDGLTEGNKYIDVIGIRAREIPSPTKWNQKEIEWLMEAKAAYALDLTEEERQEQYENDVKGVFDVLMQAIKQGVKTDV